MELENITVVLGIPIPSTDPVLLAVVGVHVVFGLAAVIAGALAMLSKKRRGSRRGGPVTTTVRATS
jgi:hypothetical protein